MTDFTLLTQLCELLTPGNVHQHAGKEAKHLTDTDEYKAVQKLDANYAKKLLLAWDGDARDYDRNKGKGFDPLFPKMLDPKAIEKFAPDLDDATVRKLQILKRLHDFSFPTGHSAPKTDNSNWSQERWVKEGFDIDTYNELHEEVNKLGMSAAPSPGFAEEFTAALEEVHNHVERADHILKASKFKAWMKSTDQDWNTNCTEAFNDVIAAMKKVKDSLEALDDELDKAS